MFLQQKAGHISPESMGAVTFVNNAPCKVTIQSDHFNQTVVTHKVRTWTRVCIAQFVSVLYFFRSSSSFFLFPHAPLLSHSLCSHSILLPHSPTLFPSTHMSSSLYSLNSPTHSVPAPLYSLISPTQTIPRSTNPLTCPHHSAHCGIACSCEEKRGSLTEDGNGRRV